MQLCKFTHKQKLRSQVSAVLRWISPFQPTNKKPGVRTGLSKSNVMQRTSFRCCAFPSVRGPSCAAGIP